jgi:hypothetical protein
MKKIAVVGHSLIGFSHIGEIMKVMESSILNHKLYVIPLTDEVFKDHGIFKPRGIQMTIKPLPEITIESNVKSGKASRRERRKLKRKRK